MVPPERRSDLRYLHPRQHRPAQAVGPAKGLPRNPRPLLRLLEEHDVPEDYAASAT